MLCSCLAIRSPRCWTRKQARRLRVTTWKAFWRSSGRGRQSRALCTETTSGTWTSTSTLTRCVRQIRLDSINFHLPCVVLTPLESYARFWGQLLGINVGCVSQFSSKKEIRVRTPYFSSPNQAVTDAVRSRNVVCVCVFFSLFLTPLIFLERVNTFWCFGSSVALGEHTACSPVFGENHSKLLR